MSYAYSTTEAPAGSTGPAPFSPEDEPWYREAWDFLSGLFSRCAERNPRTWQEHILTRCLSGRRWDGQPCPGTPDPRRAALAAERDPATAREIAGKLRGWNEGWSPSVQEMADPRNAILWTFAVAGGLDCRNSREPDYPGTVWSWIRAQTPDWSASGPPPDLPDIPDPPQTEGEWRVLLEAARREGRDLVTAAGELAARYGFGALPEAARRALLALQADYYGDQAGDQARAALPWLIGAGLALALLRR